MQSVLPLFRFSFLAIVATAVALRALGQPLDHDEHQFVASAALIARDGLVPYRDFAYFHLPYQSYLFAIPFQWSEYLLATARLVCAAAAFSMVAIVWRRVRTEFEELPEIASTALAVLFALVLVTNPLFLYSAGRAWNHDIATLLGLLAAIAAATPPGEKNRYRAAVTAGLFAGLAVGFRSTFATLVPALAFAIWWLRDRSEDGFSVRSTTAFAAGVFVALSPVLVLLGADPAAFFYGNATYNLTLDPVYRKDAGFDVAMTFAQKFSYFTGDVLDHPRPAALLFAYAVSAFCAVYDRRADSSKALPLTIAFCLPALFVAAWLPTPTWYQYYYALQVFLVVGVVVNTASAVSVRRAVAFAAAMPLLFGAVTGARYHWPIADLGPSAGWTAIRAHATGRAVAASAGAGADDLILTLAPIFALEGGAGIYPQLATGPFQWRTAYLVSETDRRRFGVLGPADLDGLDDGRRPAAVMTGAEANEGEDLERPLLDFAAAAGWVADDIDDRFRLWRPKSE
jgi:hypothetical protein